MNAYVEPPQPPRSDYGTPKIGTFNPPIVQPSVPPPQNVYPGGSAPVPYTAPPHSRMHQPTQPPHSPMHQPMQTPHSPTQQPAMPPSPMHQPVVHPGMQPIPQGGSMQQPMQQPMPHSPMMMHSTPATPPTFHGGASPRVSAAAPPGSPYSIHARATVAASPSGYLAHPKMSVSQHASPTLAPVGMKMSSRGSLQALDPSTDGSGNLQHRGSNVSQYRHSVGGRSERSPLLPLDRGKGDDRQRQTTRLLFIWLGVSTLVLQTTVFITMEDVQNKLFPNMRYAFYAHNVFALSFFIGSAAIACFPARLLFSLRLLTFLNLLAIVFAVAFPAVVLSGASQHWAFVTALVLVGCITCMSVLLIPVVFTSASAVPGECAMYAAFGQGSGAVVTALIAVAMVFFLSPKQFLCASAMIAMTVHVVAILCLQRLRSYSWAANRLQRLSDSHSSKTDDARRASRRFPKCSGIMRRVFAQLICAFLSTFVSFCVFPAFSILLGHNVSRGFGVAMVAIFHACDQVGRHVPEFGLALPPLPLVFFVVCRFAFLPLYVAMYHAASASTFLGTMMLKALVQAGLGFTHGWAVASCFRHIPAALTKYEVERTQFYLSLSNALGIPSGALLMSVLVYTGYFPRL